MAEGLTLAEAESGGDTAQKRCLNARNLLVSDRHLYRNFYKITLKQGYWFPEKVALASPA